MHEVLVYRLGGLRLPRKKNGVRFTDRPDMTVVVDHGHKTTTIQQQQTATNLVDNYNCLFKRMNIFRCGDKSMFLIYMYM